MPCHPQGARHLRQLFFLLLFFPGVDPRPGDAAHLWLKAVKEGILARLGLEEPPAIRQPPDQGTIRGARQQYQEMLAQLRANQTHRAPAVSVYHLWTRVQRMELGPSQDPPNKPPGHLYSLELSRPAALRRPIRVLRARLTLFRRQQLGHFGSSQPRPSLVRVQVYKLGLDTLNRTPILLASRVVSTAVPHLSLWEAVKEWLSSPEPQFHLGLAFSPEPAEGLLDLKVALDGTKRLPLEVEAQELGQPGRKRRQLEASEAERCGKGEGNCCLRSVRVSFEAIGWADWVAAPRSYTMGFCQGSCPHNYKPASIHAQIKSRLHSLSGETPAPCCVPAAYEPMVLMHYGDDGKVVTQLFEDMIVTRCHCA